MEESEDKEFVNLKEVAQTRRKRRSKAEMRSARLVEIVERDVSNEEVIEDADQEVITDEPLPANFTLLSNEEVEKLRKEAEAEAYEEKKTGVREQAKTFLLREARQRLDPVAADDLVNFYIDLPGFTDRLVIDGQHLISGTRVTKPRRVYDSIREMVARAWGHEVETGFANRKEYARRPPIPHETVVSAKRGIKNAPNQNRDVARSA